MAEWDGLRIIGHGGGTIGQASFLQAIPERELVIVLLTNAATGGDLWEDLGRWLFETLAGVRMPRVLRAADPPPDISLDDYAGTYERLGVRWDVTVEDAQLVMRVDLSGSLAELQGGEAQPPLRLRPVDRENFVTADGQLPVGFLEFRKGRPGYLFDGRAARRSGQRAKQKPKP